VQTHVARHDAATATVAAELHGSARRARRAGARASTGRAAVRAHRRPALLRQAFEVRVPCTTAVSPRRRRVAAFHDAHEQLYGYCFRDRPEQQVEW
jgi:N-methylhydantoinase A